MRTGPLTFSVCASLVLSVTTVSCEGFSSEETIQAGNVWSAGILSDRCQELKRRFQCVEFSAKRIAAGSRTTSHLIRSTTASSGETEVISDTFLTACRSEDRWITTFTRNPAFVVDRPKVVVKMSSPDQMYNLEGDEISRLTVRKHANDASSLERARLGTFYDGKVFVEAAFSMFEFNGQRLFDESYCQIISIEPLDNDPKIVKVSFKFLAPDFWLERGWVNIDLSKGFLVNEYRLEKDQPPGQLNATQEDDSSQMSSPARPKLFSIEGKASYLSDIPDPTTDCEATAEKFAQRFVPTDLVIHLQRVNGDGIIEWDDNWHYRDIQTTIEPISDSIFSMSAFGLPELTIDAPTGSGGKSFPWKMTGLVVLLNVPLICLLGYVWKRSRKPA